MRRSPPRSSQRQPGTTCTVGGPGNLRVSRFLEYETPDDDSHLAEPAARTPWPRRDSLPLRGGRACHGRAKASAAKQRAVWPHQVHSRITDHPNHPPNDKRPEAAPDNPGPPRTSAHRPHLHRPTPLLRSTNRRIPAWKGTPSGRVERRASPPYAPAVRGERRVTTLGEGQRWA